MSGFWHYCKKKYIFFSFNLISVLNFYRHKNFYTSVNFQKILLYTYTFWAISYNIKWVILLKMILPKVSLLKHCRSSWKTPAKYIKFLGIKVLFIMIKDIIQKWKFWKLDTVEVQDHSLFYVSKLSWQSFALTDRMFSKQVFS